MEIINNALLVWLYRKSKKYFCFLFLFFTILSFGQITDNTSGGPKSYTVPANVTSIKAEVWGSGGSGGGSTANGNGGSGAGGGGYTTKTFDVISGQIINYTVGAGAAAGVAGANGNNGNASTLTHAASGTNLTGNGGGRGNANGGAVGVGGTGTGGFTNIAGSNGGAGGTSTGGNGGDGGNTLGTGGAGQNNNNGSTGTIPGGGGGGGEYGNGSTQRAGGAGANGQVKLTFISVASVSPNPVCVGSTITITGTNFNTSGTTTVSINGTACTSVTVLNSTTITAVVAAGTTSGVVLVDNPNGTNNGKSITVNPLPTAVTITGTTPACSSTTLTASNGGSGTIYWQSTTSNGTSTATPSTSQVVTASGTYYFRALSAEGCWGPQGSITVVINTPPAAIAGGAASVCVGATTPAFTNSTPGGAWSIINGTGSATITAGGVVTGVTAGNVTVVYTVGTCSPVTKSLTINTAPSAIGGGASTVCTGSVTPAFTNAVGGGTWSISNGTGSATITAGGIVTGGSTGSATVVYTIGSCSVSTSITVIATPTITTNPSNVSVASGTNTSFTIVASNVPTTYTWQVSTDGGATWNNVSNGGMYSNATTATLNISGVTLGMNGYLYRASATNNCGTSLYSSNATLNVQYCAPTFNTNNIGKIYIRSFKYIGVLNDDFLTANISTQSGANGAYQDFTGLTPKAEQVRGSVVNVESICTGSISSGGTIGWGYWMAWVDWNRDGVFSSSEVVYSLQNYSTGSVTFGFIIPSNQALGDYRVRIAVMSAKTTSSCGLNTSYGELEDYIFTVVEDNNAKLDTSKPSEFSRCDVGVVPMTVYGSDANAVNFKWYDAKYGGNLLSTGANYAPNLSTTTTFYVSVVDTNGKETPFRYPIVARIDPIPQVTFTPTPETICGEDDPYLLLSVWGDSREVTLLNEKFDTGLGAFYNVVADTYLGANTTPYSYNWTVKASPYAQTNPPHEAIASSVSSGYFGGNFAIMNSDGAERINKNVLRHLVSTSTYDTTLFLANQIKLDFDLYYFSIALLETDGYFKVEYSVDGNSWTTFKTYVLNTGNPLFWNKVSIDLDASGVPRSSNLQIRFSLYSRGFSSGYYESVATLDNIKLYGKLPLDRDFDWSGADNVVLYDKTCTTPLGNTLAREVCVKPPLDEFEKPYWTLQASATFQSGCPAIGSTVVYNDTKIWNQPGKTDWKQSDDWKPVGVPDIKKCVIARTPVILPTGSTGTHGLARSVIVKSGGKLTVEPKSSLTIQNYIKNEALTSDVIIQNDANLIQINNVAVNSGNITVNRSANLKKLDYNFWGSPVIGQNVKAFSPQTLDTRFYVYNESNDYFDGLFIKNLYPDNVTYSQTPTVDKNTYNFIIGKGYAIRSANNLTDTTSEILHKFEGIPFNGILDVPLVKSATGGGYNLITNPFPSNIDFYALYGYAYNGGASKNSDIIYETAYFWTNTNYNPKMQGSSYPSNLPSGTQIINNYAVLNGTGGISAPYGFSGTGVNDPIGSVNNCPSCKVPTQIIKVGQGFIVKAKNNGNLRFENGANIRTNNPNANFFNRIATKEITKDRYWISLKTPLDFVTPLLVGYVEGATNGYEEDFDAELFILGGDSFYSLLENKKLGIQGKKYPFNQNDVVNLGARFGEEGTYEIALDGKEGIFANGQNIYLKDNITGTITNLSEGAYRFVARSGEVNNRFQILYANSTLGFESGQTEKEFIVYQQNHYAMISTAESMKSVKIYDITGKLIFHKKVNKKDFQIDTSSFQSGTYVIEVLTTNRYFTKKIIK